MDKKEEAELARIFLKQITLFLSHLSGHFSGFIYFNPQKTNSCFSFYKNFRKEKLSIVIFIPVVKNEEDMLAFQGRRIKIILKTTKGAVRINFADTIISSRKWKRSLHSKIKALEALMEKISPCEKCKNILIPLVCRSKKTGAKFVSLRCENCETWINIPYNIGLKKSLHKHLKKD